MGVLQQLSPAMLLTVWWMGVAGVGVVVVVPVKAAQSLTCCSYPPVLRLLLGQPKADYL